MTADEGDRRLYLTVRELHGRNRPAQVYRSDVAVLLVVDPFADRPQLLARLSQILVLEEFEEYLHRLGLGEFIEWLEGAGPIAVPEELWVPAHATAV